MRRPIRFLTLLTFVLLVLPVATAQDLVPPGKSPGESLRSIRVRPGFSVELVAAEPLVRDPIAFDWSPDGRLWVLEMGDYPLGGENQGKPDGRVRVLADSDGDGRYDRSTVFLDGLSFPAGLIVWRNGALIACAPEIFHAEDRDGDGRADGRTPLFHGFREGNPQHRVNGFEYGLDGWIYGANGDSGGTIRSLKTGEEVSISGRDFRFRPDTGAFEAESGQTQYGRHRDDWGNWFGNSNPIWAWQYVLTDRDMKRNAAIPLSDPRKILEPDTRLFPISPILARFNDPEAAGRVTSANSPTPYRDDLFGPDFATSLFISEPVHNLVHRMVLAQDGATLQGHRAPDEMDREFLASSDNWFRPTMLRVGPDGALWIADMYRAVIEHPEWIPDDVEAKLDLRAGHDQGRIYRVYPSDRRPRPIPRLDRLDTPGLVAALESPGGWARDTAQRLLLEKRDPAAIPPLRGLAAASPHPKTRVQALWTLACLDALSAEAVVAALRDEHPEVRRNALLASEPLWKPPPPPLADAARTLADDPDARVRFALAKVVGDWDDPRAGRILALVLRRDLDDRWLRAAVIGSATRQAAAVLSSLFEQQAAEPLPAEVIEPLFGLAVARPGPGGIEALLHAATTPAGRDGAFAAWQFAAATGLLDASARAGHERPRDDRLDALSAAARDVARSDQAPESDRVLALRFLARAGWDQEQRREVVRDLLRPDVPAPIQRAAVEAMARSGDPKTPEILLAGWKAHGPALRSQILDALTSRAAWAGALLSSLEDRCVSPAEIDAAHRRLLLGSRDESIRNRARAVFESTATAGRQEVLDRYRAALPPRGDSGAGLNVYRRACASCHRWKGQGIAVGPSLEALTDRSTEALLVAILDPNRAFESKYASYTIQTTDGRVLNGLIAAETSAAVTLRRQEGEEDRVPRRDIEAMVASGQSLMPEGLEKDLTPADIANLVALLAASGPPRKELPGNNPELVRPGADGTVALRPAQAEIYGPSVVLEPRYGNLGYWSSTEDHAAWEFELAQGGRFEVILDAACDDASAGNHYVVAVGPSRLEGRVESTGSWDQYRETTAGALTLEPGRHRLEIRPDGPVRGALMDLRAIRLRPSR
jgi:putative membrane-bound dehydrogenase-like protein